jgi:hypothetical protein
MAGYSGTPLVKKIGIKENHRVLLISPPTGFSKTLGKLPAGAKVLKNAEAPVHVVVGFAKSRTDVSARFAETVSRLDQAGMIWISWPKKASGWQLSSTRTLSARSGWQKVWWTSRSVPSTTSGRA